MKILNTININENNLLVYLMKIIILKFPFQKEDYTCSSENLLIKFMMTFENLPLQNHSYH